MGPLASSNELATDTLQCLAAIVYKRIELNKVIEGAKSATDKIMTTTKEGIKSLDNVSKMFPVPKN